MTGASTFISSIADFQRKSEAQKVLVFGWYLHTAKQQERFDPADLRRCFDEAHLPHPSNIPRELAKLCSSKPVKLLRDQKGYRLSATARAEIGEQLPQRATSIVATDLLDQLITQVTDPLQMQFVYETYRCFKHQAYRAAIVMAWNLAYSEVQNRILSTDLPRFNAQLKQVVQRSSPITQRSDFEDYKESKILEVARGAGDLSAASYKILLEKLNKRNLAAHPSDVTFSPVQAEEVIHDLIKNIVLKPTL